MPERPGSREARALFSSNDIVEWSAAIRSYKVAVGCVAISKNKQDLVRWDTFLWEQLPLSIMQRSPPHLTLQELSAIMKWKLARGKARPLQKMVDSNAPSAVISASKKALSCLGITAKVAGADANASETAAVRGGSGARCDWEGALAALMILKGIGVATGTAVLAALAPHSCPFMADEVIEAATSCGRDYTLKVYRVLRIALVKKAQELNALTSGGTRSNISGDGAKSSAAELADSVELLWDAERVGKALWVRAMAAAYPEQRILTLPSTLPGPTDAASSHSEEMAQKGAGEQESLPATKKRRVEQQPTAQQVGVAQLTAASAAASSTNPKRSRRA